MFGDDLSAAAHHFITTGYAQGRTDTALAGRQVVSMPHTGDIVTTGDHSQAIHAQSIGGGGGNGGSALSAATSNKYAASVSIGGFGGGGGDGDAVVVFRDGGTLNTSGKMSTAIFAQSVGGGGGNGGSTSASGAGAEGALEEAGAAAWTGLVGDLAGKATLAIASKLSESSGESSKGDAAAEESPDNGAGAGISIGGAGGGGGHGGIVQVETAATVLTSGALSNGVFAQSIGGGGGNGGSAVSDSKGGIAAASVSLGGTGGGGGNGNKVDVRNHGSITTSGSQATAVFAQSVGGGGGNGGAAHATSESGGIAAVSLGLGGSGGGGGTGGTVLVRNDGTISATGSNSAGVFAQSVGGGGGNGGAASAGAVAAMSEEDDDKSTSASTKPASSAPDGGKSAASAGKTGNGSDKGAGAGSSGGYAAGIAIGGAGGTSSPGGDVKVENTGTITTGTADKVADGANAHAIFAQSIGGGGGNGGSTSSEANAGKASVALSVGGTGAGGGNGGQVRAGSTGTLSTYAANSAAIFAQSVGGGGGTGGSASSKTGDGGATSVALGLGGSGEGGGDSGWVYVCGTFKDDGSCATFLSGTVTTAGANSHGVFAQSVGGGGGSGGSVTTATTAKTADKKEGAVAMASNDDSGSESSTESGVAVSMGLGGKGAYGGSSGVVQIQSAARVTTTGDFATALFGQSVGGGGGAGGTSISNANGGTYAVALALGGSGGRGGQGGEVYVSAMRGSVLTTSGTMSHGIFAQSVGGGGGAAGVASATAADGGDGSGSLSLSGAGGGNQHAQKIHVWSDGKIATSGAGSSAIMAQSIGGGGGNTVSRLATISAGDTSMSFQVGASTSQGNGEDVSVRASFDPAVYTAGYTDLINAFGQNNAAAQAHYVNTADMRSPTAFNVSQYWANNADLRAGYGADVTGLANHYIGGGRNEDRSLSVGAGSVADYTNAEYGRYSTTGNQATAIIAQSIGAGGGVAISDVARGTAGKSVTAPLNLGATSSSAAGRGKSVTLITGDGTGGTRATLTTTGVNSSGIIAQSIGGGGGIASFYIDRIAPNGTISAPVTLGSKAHGHNEGGTVDMTIGSTTIDLTGGNSYGLVAQSIGGGGGVATFAAGSTGNGASGSAQLGQYDGDAYSSTSSTVNVASHANIAVHGQQSAGIVAQSISAGGGLASMLTTNNATFNDTVRLGHSRGSGGQTAGAVNVNNYGTITTSAVYSPGLVAQSVAGGGGLSLTRHSAAELGDGVGGVSGAVTVSNASAIVTNADASPGIVAQSVGGGGGFAIANSAKFGGGQPGADAGTVNVTSNAAIETHGRNSPGIIAQSVGGGGGVVLSNSGSVSTTFVRGAGSSSDVTVTINNSVTTSGDYSHGVIAQSIRGGGGIVLGGSTSVVQDAGGDGRSGVVYVNGRANVHVSGAGSSAIVAMSSNDPVIDIAEGVQITGGVGGSALLLDSPISQITNAGTLSTMDGAAGRTVHSLSGDTTFTNKGTLIGSVKLAQGGTNVLHNLAGATINAGASLDLGGGTLNNAGVLANAGTLGKVTINGSLLQSEGASLLVRLDQATGAADSFEVTGTGKLAGTLRPTLLNLGAIKPGTILKTIITAAGDLDVSGLKVESSVILSHALSVRNGQVSLASTVDFAPAALSESGKVIGKVIAHAQSGGLTHFHNVVPTLLAMKGRVDLDQAYYNLSGAATSAMSTVGTQMSTAFMATLVRQPGGSNDGRDWNLWGQGLAGSIETDNPNVGMGHLSAHMRGLAMGIDHRFDANTTFGMAMGLGASGFATANGVNGKADVYQFGVYGLRRFNAAYVAGTLSAARYDNVLGRLLPLTGGRYVASLRARNYGGRLEAGYRLSMLSGGITPYAAAQVQDFVTPAYSERASAQSPTILALSFDQRSTWDKRFELGSAFDNSFALGRERRLALRMTAAWVHRASSNPDVAARFQADQTDGFHVAGAAPVADLGQLSANAELRLTPNLSLGMRVESEMSARTDVHSGTARLSYRW